MCEYRDILQCFSWLCPISTGDRQQQNPSIEGKWCITKEGNGWMDGQSMQLCAKHYIF